jgi:ABC-2 type transport system ATP-binding protein
MSILEIKNFSKTYRGDKKAVDCINLSVEPGDIFAFIGHNGAGKTTTIRSAVGILDFEGGDIFIDGLSIKEEPIACKSVIAYIPDNPDLYEHLTGIGYLSFAADIYGVSARDRERGIKKYGDEFELTPNLGDLVASYSHGMKQKLALIGALIHHPKLMILDEPFVGLDPKAALALKNQMHELCGEGGAVFFSTHVLDVAEKLCNKVAMIDHGKIVAYGNMEAVLGNESLEEMFMEKIDSNKRGSGADEK